MTPFDEEDEEETQSPTREGLKKVSSQKSIFDGQPKKPSQADLDKRVKNMQERDEGYKRQAAQLAIDFNKIIKDKTLRNNKNVIQRDMEQELIDKMITFAFQVNHDEAEQEGAGSVSLILLLLKATLYQRDRINELEYNLMQVQKAQDALTQKLEGLDKPKPSE
jgi:hypothetical protein